MIEKPSAPRSPEDEGVTRRQALVNLATGAAGLAFAATDFFRNRETPERENGIINASERFNGQVEGFKYQYGRLRRNEILFVDRVGRPLGEVVPIRDEGGRSPGRIDGEGILVGSLNQEWLNFERERVVARTGRRRELDLARELPQQLNVIPAIREAVYQDPGKDELNPETFLDIVHYFGRKPVVGHEDQNRIQYLHAHAMDRAELPDSLKARLTYLLPGLAAQESKFNNATVSATGARGVLQFMPDTWRDYGYRLEDLDSFAKQVEAVGRHLTVIYRTITMQSPRELERIEQEFFAGDRERYEHDLLIPLILNAYNTGQGRIREVIRHFLTRFPNREALEHAIGEHPEGLGADTFQTMTFVASTERFGSRGVRMYGRDSSEYVARLTALADLLASEY